MGMGLTMNFVPGVPLGIALWFVVRCVLSGFYTVDQNERAVVTTFGRADRFLGRTTLEDPIAATLNEDEKQRYAFPMVRVVMPGGPYFKFPWQKVYKVTIATQTVSVGYDPETPSANQSGSTLEAVTKDQLNTGLQGQLRFNVSDRNLYAFLFGVKNPVAHVMGYFISILRERIANFEAQAKAADPNDPSQGTIVQGISINDLRKNLSDISRHMEQECASAPARYGIALTATLITTIDPPTDVESALAAINTAHNQVSSSISLAQAAADQKIVQSRKAVEIETLRAQAETQLLSQMAGQLTTLKTNGADALALYIRNIKLALYNQAKRAILEVEK
jgi:regulator of protease activity HflC (stomatin/prohibitin superfamily)